MANGKYLFAARQSPFAGARAPDSLLRFSLSFAGLVVLARSMNPIPSRTRPLNSSAPMVLWLKPWESRSLPGLPRTRKFPLYVFVTKRAAFLGKRRFFVRPPVASRSIFRHDDWPPSRPGSRLVHFNNRNRKKSQLS